MSAVHINRKVVKMFDKPGNIKSTVEISSERIYT